MVFSHPTRRDVVRSLLLAGTGALLGRGAHAADPATIATRTIPRSGERVPVVGLGTWQAFDIGNDASRRREAAETLRTFLDAGLRIIDTSPMYGSAEAVVGELLEPLDPDHRVFLATKVWAKGADAGSLQIEQSFRRLRRERIDLIQVHNLVDTNLQLPTLTRLKQEGRLRYVGVTHHAASGYPELVKHIESGTVDFVQVNYSLLEREAETTVLAAAAHHGVAVLINRPFADGDLFAKVNGRALPAVAVQIGAASWAQLALKWVISHPAVTCAIPGTRNPGHLLDNIGAATGAMPDARMRARIAAAFDSAT